MMIVTKDMQTDFITEHLHLQQASGGLPQGCAGDVARNWIVLTLDYADTV